MISVSVLQRGISRYAILLFTNPRFLLHLLLNAFKKDFSFNISFYTPAQLSEEIQKGRSLIRIGDGEISIMNGTGIWYQPYETDIKEALTEAVYTYSSNSKYVLCINEHVMNKTNTFLKKHNQLRMWLPMKTWYDLYFPKNCSYGDATSFYYKDIFEIYVYPYIRHKKIIIISIEKNIFNLKNNKNLPEADIEYITVRDIGSFVEKDSVYQKIETLKNGVDNNNVVLLFSCGPAGKVFALEWVHKGVQSIDIGLAIELIFSNREHPYVILPKEKA
ncbi:MAG: hypothetical protein RI935_748 [Candidatus Parcubacteria bacterium]|jgi:hypothetical protein